MKVRVTFTVDIDPEAWELIYGVPREQIREDVKYHAEYIARETLRDQRLLMGQ